MNDHSLPLPWPGIDTHISPRLCAVALICSCICFCVCVSNGHIELETSSKLSSVFEIDVHTISISCSLLRRVHELSMRQSTLSFDGCIYLSMMGCAGRWRQNTNALIQLPYKHGYFMDGISAFTAIAENNFAVSAGALPRNEPKINFKYS